MATITISDLSSDSESYMTELIDSDLSNINGGVVPILLGALAVIGTINTAVDVYYGARNYYRGFKKELNNP